MLAAKYLQFRIIYNSDLNVFHSSPALGTLPLRLAIARPVEFSATIPNTICGAGLWLRWRTRITNFSRLIRAEI